MRIIIGLGNPGRKYERTRHNAGFWVVDELAERFDAAVTKHKWRALIGECQIGWEKVILVKPETFMNLSGESVYEVCSFYSEVDVSKDLIVVYDDMDFAVGQVKLRESGSAGGHNGMKSIIAHLGTSSFPRVRFGIGRPETDVAVIDHVLSTFSPQDEPKVKSAISKSADALEYACKNSFSAAMNRYNGGV